MTINGSKPPIWRKLAVPSDMVLGELREVIQIAMGWTNSHLHQFKQGNEYFVTKETPWGEPTDMEGEDAVTLGEVCLKVKSNLIYEYDFGDGWDAHGRGRRKAPVDARIARLAIHAASTVSLFYIETWNRMKSEGANG